MYLKAETGEKVETSKTSFKVFQGIDERGIDRHGE